MLHLPDNRIEHCATIQVDGTVNSSKDQANSIFPCSDSANMPAHSKFSEWLPGFGNSRGKSGQYYMHLKYCCIFPSAQKLRNGD